MKHMQSLADIQTNQSTTWNNMEQYGSIFQLNPFSASTRHIARSVSNATILQHNKYEPSLRLSWESHGSITITVILSPGFPAYALIETLIPAVQPDLTAVLILCKCDKVSLPKPIPCQHQHLSIPETSDGFKPKMNIWTLLPLA